MIRPVYTPKEQIITSLYTSGQQWMTNDDIEYIGLYHRYPNGAVYSESEFNDFSVELKPYVRAIETENTSAYYKLTGTRFNNYMSPEYYYPILSDQDYTKANLTRYFVQLRNNLSYIIEIDADSYKNINQNNDTGIDAGQYNKEKIQWTISGPKNEVLKSNERVISNSRMPELVTYLTDLLEFYK